MVVSAQDILRQVPEREQRVAIAQPPAPTRPEIDVLIERGDASANAVTRRLAARLRTSLAELREALKAEAEQEQVVAQIAQLRKQLDEAEARLNRLRGVQPRAGRAAGLDTSKVRAWAADNGLKVAAAGMVPAKVLDAYRAAHGGGS